MLVGTYIINTYYSRISFTEKKAKKTNKENFYYTFVAYYNIFHEIRTKHKYKRVWHYQNLWTIYT